MQNPVGTAIGISIKSGAGISDAAFLFGEYCIKYST